MHDERSNDGPRGRHGLGFAGYFGGFWAFLLVLVLGTAGLIGGLALQGDLDLRTRRQR
ncbi:hypothetical protein [Streptomyces sp. LN245]|uniref:hypothetical protein n=1 Tax=Streptomyces sp. LN245 TaxID=3112975 RepID=UPI0037118DE9